MLNSSLSSSGHCETRVTKVCAFPALFGQETLNEGVGGHWKVL